MSVPFSEGASFWSAIFSGRADFSSATFSEGAFFWSAKFSDITDFDEARFSEVADFSYVIFSGEVSFETAIFSKMADFGSVTFSGKADFRSVTFSGKADFGSVTFSAEADFSEASFEDIFSVKEIIFKDKDIENLNINLSGCTVKNKLMFSLNDDNNYGKTIFNLHNSNINYFTCDDKELENIKLYWENPIDGYDKKMDKKSKIERFLHELRIMRRILQDLNWGDGADRYYAKIMDKQLELKKITLDDKIKKKGIHLATLGIAASFWFEKIVYQKCFGWGVRIRNVGFTVLFSILTPFLVTYIAWSFFVKSISVAKFLTTLEFTIRAFFTLDVTVSSDMPNWFLPIGLTESALGLLIYTLFVAILARKFMRL